MRLWRFHQANRAAAVLMNRGEFVFSPISHTHPIAVDGSLPTDWNFWEAYDRAVLRSCGQLIVLTLPGWRESTGVTAEIQIANELGLPVSFLDPDEVLLPCAN